MGVPGVCSAYGDKQAASNAPVLVQRPSVSLSPHSRAYPQGPLLRNLEILHFTTNPPTPSAACASSSASSSSPPGSTRPVDRLWKVRPVISAVVAACRANYRPHWEQAIDEVMVPFKGRSSMKQYLPMKPVKRGFKIWVRADSHNGYVCEFECYTGKKGDTTEFGLGGCVVTRLTRDLVGKAYHIFMDSFFYCITSYCQTEYIVWVH